MVYGTTASASISTSRAGLISWLTWTMEAAGRIFVKTCAGTGGGAASRPRVRSTGLWRSHQERPVPAAPTAARHRRIPVLAVSEFASAIVVVDALIWEGADEQLITALPWTMNTAQYLLRSLLFGQSPT
jgi:hypothetical protein